jgi:hypothetical protein
MFKDPANSSKSTDDDDDEHHSSNRSASDNGSDREDESNRAGISIVTAVDLDDDPNATVPPDALTLKRKRTNIDESVLSEDDLLKLENRRAYNRHCAAKGDVDSCPFDGSFGRQRTHVIFVSVI